MTHIWHFNGKYDSSKSKLFWLLISGPNSWYTPRQVAWVTGIPLETARAQCRRLHSASPPYIKRRFIGDKQWQFYYQYQIGARGSRWWLDALAHGMPINRYLSEISAWQQQRDANNSLEGQKGGE